MKDGGPAFPGIEIQYSKGHPVQTEQVYHTGCSLRDWFAGMALAGFCACASDPETNGIYLNSWASMMAKFAYTMADAMLAAREKKAEDNEPTR